MTKVEFQLTKDDLLQFYLYRCTHLDLNRRLRRRHRSMVPVAFLGFSLILFLNERWLATILFCAFAVAWYAFSPFLLRRRIRDYYRKYIDENCQSFLDSPFFAETRPDGIFLSSYAGESLCRYSAIDHIGRDPNHTYLCIGKETAIVLPHDKVSETEIKAFLSEIERQRAAERDSGEEEDGTAQGSPES